MRKSVLLLVGLLCAQVATAAEPLRVMWLDDGRPSAREVDARSVRRVSGEDWKTPLGSVWKLFVHAWLTEHAVPEQPYVCRGGVPDEVYCCDPGGSIGREQALLKSCGLYFAPQRWAIDREEWRNEWAQRDAPAWLRELDALGPAQHVPVAELLQALARLPAQADIRDTLSAALLGDDDARALITLGARLRVKTWSWHRDDVPNTRIGGFAGWLADGTPVWAEAGGTSRSMLREQADALARVLPVPLPAAAGECVDVAMFARYPIIAVESAGKAVAAGRLVGDYRLRFAAGNEFDVHSDGELLLDGEPGAWHVRARLDREDYVARVLEREAGAQPIEAARALAVVIRTYLLQQARREGDCLQIDDSSASQRVAARPPSEAVRQAAGFSDGLILSGAPVQYHLERGGENRLPWRDAVAAAERGEHWLHILNMHFPRLDVVAANAPAGGCEALEDAERWLAAQLPAWQRRLAGDDGFEAIDEPQVCRLAGGRPHVDRERQRIFVRGLHSQQDRLDLAHEYLHLAFSYHPRGHDEDFVETVARQLILE